MLPKRSKGYIVSDSSLSCSLRGRKAQHYSNNNNTNNNYNHSNNKSSNNHNHSNSNQNHNHYQEGERVADSDCVSEAPRVIVIHTEDLFPCDALVLPTASG